MIIRYNDCIDKFGSNYQLEKALKAREIYKLDSGLYSNIENVPELAIIAMKYPNAIITGDNAFYIHSLTDMIPSKYSLATKSSAAKINNSKVMQIYVRDDIIELGVEEKNIDGYNIRVYDKERMLIELLRNKNKMPYDLYKEILLKYRTLINSLQIWRIQEYIEIFPKSKMIKKALDIEVF